jgi:DNA polymerase III subunit epsilon
MFPDPAAFVDLETTGITAAADRVTEVGIVRVEGGRATEWSTLVNPQCSIPAGVQALTGITNAMVARAPTFAAIAGEILTRIGGCVFVAHNARFDYGFLKHEFARLGQPFTAKVLCTVKLSRRLFPEAARHSLDRLVERHRLPAKNRHRALGDARVLWEFIRAIYRDRPASEVDAVVGRMLRSPSLPPNLAPGALDAIPESPGVYRLYSANPLPLYVGKSINLRERVASHFSSDYRSANDLRLSYEVVRIDYEVTAGELGALLRESQLVKSGFPAYNRRLRQRRDLIALKLASEPSPPRYVGADAIAPRAFKGLYGPFNSRRAARDALRDIARDSALCLRLLGLEHRAGPCFGRQVGKCAGACVGAETAESHHHRLLTRMAPRALQEWPYPAMVWAQETSVTGDRTDFHVFQDWCWVGTAQDSASLQAILDAPPQVAFDLDIYRVLHRRLPRLPMQVVATDAGNRSDCIPEMG